MESGDYVKRKASSRHYYDTVGYNDVLEILEMKDNSSGNGKLIRMKKIQDKDRMLYHSEKSWFKASNFQVIEERSTLNGKNDIFLVFSMLPEEDGSHKINLEAGAVQYPSEKDAKSAVAKHLEDNPETVWGIFPLAYLVKVEKPPVKFTVIWKR